MLDLHRLRLLRELKHRGTLTAVAAALAYSPSSISQQLSLLEKEAGVPLLEPVGRRVRLTDQAEILVAHTEAVLEQLERAEAEIAASLRELTSVLRVAAFQTAALTLVPFALTALRAAHPKLRVQVTQTEPETALPALLARDFDLVITEEYPGDPEPRPAEVELAPLCDEEIRLAAPHPVTRLRDLAQSPWAMEPTGSASRHWATTVCREAGFEPDVRFESADLMFQLRLVEQGHAVAFLPDLVWGGQPPTVVLSALSALSSAPRAAHRRKVATAVRRGGGAHPAVQAFRTALSGAVAALCPAA